jgi:hypothetical protein
MKHGILLGARCDCIMIRLHRLIETANGGIVPMLPTFGKLSRLDKLDCWSDYCYNNRRQCSRCNLACFGGLAVYDYATWSSTRECDYTDTLMTNGWKLSSNYKLPSGDSCEHVVFQQCLLDKFPDMQVGIQPNLLIGRDAALLSTREPYVGMFKIVIVLMLFAYCLRQALRRRCRLSLEGTCRRKGNRGE